MNQLKALFLFILLACSLNITAQRIKGSEHGVACVTGNSRDFHER